MGSIYMKQPLVSIVIALFNSNPEHLLVALNSALVQTLVDIEVLVVDDSPTDSLRNLVNALDDPRVFYEHNIPALGVSSNHWHAFRRARGEYISVLNHDDCLQPEFAATLASELTHEPAAVIAFCDHWIIDCEGRILLKESDRNSYTYGRAALESGLHLPFIDLLLKQTVPLAMGAMFRRCALPDELPVEAGPAYDLWITYLLARTGGGACYVPERLSAWRIHTSNITGSGSVPWFLGSATLWEAVANDPLFALYHSLAKRKAKEGFLSCATRSWRDGKKFDCHRFSLRSMQVSFSLRAVVILLVSTFVPAKIISTVYETFRVKRSMFIKQTD
jgi:glycosyltransferase involved in cell wall biosynthesis